MSSTINDSSGHPVGPTSIPLRKLRLRVGPFLVAAVLFVLIVLGGLWHIGVFGGNCRVVVPGVLYRSAQLTGSNLKRELESNHIKSEINLRGDCSGASWYEDELAQCRSEGVSHADVSLSATHLPPPDQVRRLVNIFDHFPKPMLVHCMGGADRSGLASALFVAIYEKEPVDQAVHDQLTLRYGHVRWSKSRAMDQFFRMYEENGDGLDIKHWIFREYPALYRLETHHS